jgi:hypothetical protein
MWRYGSMLLNFRNKITGGIRNDKKFATHFSLAKSNLSTTNFVENDNSKQVLYTFYKLSCNNLETKEVFVGYTTLTMKDMLKLHKKKYNNVTSAVYNRRIYQVVRANGGFSNWSIVVLEKCNFNDREKALERKKEWIEKTPNDVNMLRPITTPEERKEYQKEYRTDNQIAISEQRKEYYIFNRVKKLEKQKEYSDNHQLQKKAYDKKCREDSKDRRKENREKRNEAKKIKLNEEKGNSTME